MEYPSYPEYKDSGVDWLGEVPAHWEVLLVKYTLSRPITDGPHTTPKLYEKGIPFISAEAIKNGVVDFSKKRGNISIEDHKDFCLKYRPQIFDVFMVKSGATTGSVAIVTTKREFSIWSPLAVFRSKKSIQEPFFLYYYLQSYGLKRGIELAWSFGTQQNIGMGVLGRQPSLLPPLSEQKAIAAFLDAKAAQIDQAIAQNERMVALLRERQQIVVQEAVTKGLDPEVKMKDSGVEWIGEVPEHWEVVRLKSIYRLVTEPAPLANDLTLLSVYTEIGVRPRKTLPEKGNKASTTDGYWIVKKGDFIVNKLLAWMGAVGLSEFEGVTSPAYDVLRPKQELKGYYFHALFRSPRSISEFKRNSRGIMDMRLRLYFDKMGNIKVPLPPLPEQKAIVAHIEAQAEKTDRAISLLEQQNDRLKEYKTVLIDRAVTGKINITDHVPLAPTE